MNPPQQMPQMTNQINNMSTSTACPPQQMPQATNQMSKSTPAPMSFAERSQMMQQQSAVSQQYMQTPAPMYQQQQQRDTFSPAGFHRPDPTQMSPGQVPTTYVYSNTEAAGQSNTIALHLRFPAHRIYHSLQRLRVPSVCTIRLVDTCVLFRFFSQHPLKTSMD